MVKRKRVPSLGDEGGKKPKEDKPNYIINEHGTRVFARSAAVETTYTIKMTDVKDDTNLIDLVDELHQAIDEGISLSKSNLDPENDLMRVVVRQANLDGAFVIPMAKVKEFDAGKVVSRIETLLSSHQNLKYNQTFQIDIAAVRTKKGGGRVAIRNLFGKTDNSIKQKRSLVEISNPHDELCLSRAIAVCFAKLCVVNKTEWDEVGKKYGNQLPKEEILLKYHKCSKSFYQHVTKKNRPLQKKLAVLLCEACGLPTNVPLGLLHIPKFEDFLCIDIAVVSANLNNSFIRISPYNQNRKRIFLYYVEDEYSNQVNLPDEDQGQLKEKNGHWNSIVNISGMFNGRNYVCPTCLTPYSQKGKHSCEYTCQVCKSENCSFTDDQLSCKSCNFTCRSLECYKRHHTPQKSDALSECQKFWRCKICFKVINLQSRNLEKLPHSCGEFFCTTCQKLCNSENNHRCYIRAVDRKPPRYRFVFYDFETRQDEQYQCEWGYSPSDCSHLKDSICNACSLCVQCRSPACGKMEHVVNLAVAVTCCQNCIDDDVDKSSRCFSCGWRCSQCKKQKNGKFIGPPCRSCAFRQVIFDEGDKTLQVFGEWLFNPQHKDMLCIAHNMSGFDGHLILKYLIRNSIYPQQTIYRGSKLLHAKVKRRLNITLLDSLCHIPMALKDFSESFGIPQKKGYFPHLFNTAKNQNYVGQYPEKEYFGYNYMTEEEQVKFSSWYEKKLSDKEIFNFKENLIHYCVADVDLLRRGCLKYRRLLMEVTKEIDTHGIDPFNYTTIASVCMAIYKTLFLQEKHKVVQGEENCDKSEIIITKKNGRFYFPNESEKQCNANLKTEFISSDCALLSTHGFCSDRYSRQSQQWLACFKRDQEKNGKAIYIQDALHGKEKRVSYQGRVYKLDGYFFDKDIQKHTALEYMGCLWHGCPECYPVARSKVLNPTTGQSVNELFALTSKKQAALKELGFRRIVVWEHEFLKRLEHDQELREFVETLDIQDPINPRDAFFGGRTNAIKLYHKVENYETIEYYDFCSLYPSVLKFCKFPVGFPEVINNNFGNVEDYFGLIKLKILPPKALFHPLLPHRVNGKLTFPLCATCVNRQDNKTCQCNDEARCITGTFTTPEVIKAIEKGYEVKKIYQILHWKNWSQYNKNTKTGGLFTEYVNTFLKLKQEASGWPENCVSSEDKGKYINKYFENEGILLDHDKIKKNPGLRALSKLILNSFWGKFGQRDNMPQSLFIDDSQLDTFYQLISAPNKELADIHIITPHLLQAEWIHTKDFIPDSPVSNVYIAAFTTAYARLKLYEVMEALGDRLLYFDTDSIIFVTDPEKIDPPLGIGLGELTNQLDPGDYIVEFVSAGPKNYAYRTHLGKEVVKIRGFTLNYENSKILCLETMKDLILNKTNNCVCTESALCGCNQSKRETRMGKKNKEIKCTCVLEVKNGKICRHKQDVVVYNKEEKKRYRVIYTKRVLNADGITTLPYGY